MKKIFLLFVFTLSVIGFAGTSYAGLNQKFTLFENISSTGPAEEEFVVKQAYHMWVCDVEITGSPSAVTVRVEGNAGSALFDTEGLAEHSMTAAQLSAGFGSFEIVDQKAVRIRGNLVTLTGGTSPEVTLFCVGGD